MGYFSQEQSTYVINEQEFVITGGTQSQRNQTYKALLDVFSTPVGAQMFQEIAGRRTFWIWRRPFAIALRPGSNWAGSMIGAQGRAKSQYISLDPIITMQIQTERGLVTPSLQRQIAHELGHAVFGLRDVGPGQMQTVIHAENSVMRALGEPSRTRY